MNITYESICKKLGFDPMKDPYPMVVHGYEDDSQVSPLSVLSSEEKDFLYELIKQLH